MATLLRHHDVDLPVFTAEEDTVFYSPYEKKLAPPPHGQTSFLRGMRIWGDAEFRLGLKDLLHAADETFQEVAEYCGVSIPAHEWGLRRVHATDPNYAFIERRRHLEPQGYELVATIEYIDDVTVLDGPQGTDIDTSLFRQTLCGSSEYIWRDGWSSQFVNGVGRIAAQRTIWLVDIEPCLDLRVPTMSKIGK